ncbi:MAG: hypothetical protein CMP38_04550 [Rickettsiales bacterium]|nr:hypothetical protein [Rickettsiales bacterium]
MEFVKQALEKFELESLIPYLENTGYLIFFLVILTLLIYFFFSLLLRLIFKKSDNKQERKQPSLNEIIDSDNLKVDNDNDFVDVLVAIEEEMAAVRELYVGGYISKGVYITETDRLYEKAKIFGL